MNKFLKLAAAAAVALSFAACSSSSDSKGEEDTTILVGATSSPHAIILKEAQDKMKDAGYTLEIKEFSDYPNINPSTSDGSLDANYFQHQPYLDSYNEDQGFKSGDDGYLVSAGAIHYEPLGIYSKKVKEVSLDAIEDGAQIAVPNDATNEARALDLLAAHGIITLKDGAGLKATVKDIEENPKNVEIVEVDAAQTPTKLDDVTYAVVNGNYALDANITDYLLETEDAESEAAQTFQNVIAVKEENKDNPAIVKLVEILKSDDMKKFIEDEFGVAVVPAK